MELHVLSKSYRDEANVIDLDDQLHLQWLASDDLTSHQKKRKKKGKMQYRGLSFWNDNITNRHRRSPLLGKYGTPSRHIFQMLIVVSTTRKIY